MKIQSASTHFAAVLLKKERERRKKERRRPRSEFMKGVILTQGQPFRINPDACERSRLKIQRKFNAFMAAT
jgi:hypothetical protein